MQIKTVVHSRVYWKGTNDLIGLVKKVDIPALKFNFTDLDVLGSIGQNKVFTSFDELTGAIEWASFYEDAFSARFDPTQAAEFQIHGNLQTLERGNEVDDEALVIIMSVRFTEASLGSLEARSPISGLTDNFMLEAIEVTIGGRAKLKVDIWNQIFEVDGKDLMASAKANIGA